MKDLHTSRTPFHIRCDDDMMWSRCNSNGSHWRWRTRI